VVGEALTCRRESHAPAFGFDQLRAGFVCERGDLLRHGRRRQMVCCRRRHRIEPSRESASNNCRAGCPPERLFTILERYVQENQVGVNGSAKAGLLCYPAKPADGMVCSMTTP